MPIDENGNRIRTGVHPKMVAHNEQMHIDGLEKTKLALAYRTRGYTYQQIGDAMNLTKARAWQLVKAGMEELRKEIRESAEDVRDLELSRLDAMITKLWKSSGMDDTSGEVDHKKVETMLKIMDRRSKYLGLDAAQKHEILTVDKIDAQIAALEAELAIGQRGLGSKDAE